MNSKSNPTLKASFSKWSYLRMKLHKFHWVFQHYKVKSTAMWTTHNRENEVDEKVFFLDNDMQMDGEPFE